MQMQDSTSSPEVLDLFIIASSTMRSSGSFLLGHNKNVCTHTVLRSLVNDAQGDLAWAAQISSVCVWGVLCLSTTEVKALPEWQRV